jgi:hypothetical protein
MRARIKASWFIRVKCKPVNQVLAKKNKATEVALDLAV